nr:uncharacterized protein LOC120974750 [Aegilops tauschii subsp. strangulata]
MGHECTVCRPSPPPISIFLCSQKPPWTSSARPWRRWPRGSHPPVPREDKRPLLALEQTLALNLPPSPRCCSLPHTHPTPPSSRRSCGHRPPLVAPRGPGEPSRSTSSTPSSESSKDGPYTRHRPRLQRIHRRRPASISTAPVHFRPPRPRLRAHYPETVADAPVIVYATDDPSFSPEQPDDGFEESYITPDDYYYPTELTTTWRPSMTRSS